MKKMIFQVLVIFCLTIISCNRVKEGDTDYVPNLNLSKNAAAESSDGLSVNNLIRTQLAGEVDEAFFMKASIVDVVGDTVVLFEDSPNASRLIMFDINNGNYLGQVNHRGQGPGEYRAIFSAFVNGHDGTVLIPDFDKPSVYKYSLGGDSLISTIEREPVMSTVPPIGGVGTCINVAVPSSDGLTIRQYGSNYERIDSVSVPDFIGDNFNNIWCNAGAHGVVMSADTLYALFPGELRKLAVLNRGDKMLTPEVHEKVMTDMMGGADELELLKPFIIMRDVEYTDGKMLLTTMNDGVKHSDLYDLSDGSLLYRSTYDRLSKPNCIIVKDDKGNLFEVERLFAKDGKWYGILSDDGNDVSADANNVIIRFEL